MLNFLCDFKACASLIWLYKYFSNYSFLLISLFLPLSFFCLDYCSSGFLTGTIPLFSPSPNLFFILCQSTFLKYKSVHFIPLLKILQWFPVAHKMQFNLLITAHPSSGSCLHFQHHFLLLSSLVYIPAILNYLWLLELNTFSPSFCFWNFPLAWNFLLYWSALGILPCLLHFSSNYISVMWTFKIVLDIS